MKIIGEARPTEGLKYSVEAVGGITIYPDIDAIRTRIVELRTAEPLGAKLPLHWRIDLVPEELRALRRTRQYVEMMRYSAATDEFRTLARYLYVDEVRIVRDPPAPETVEEWTEQCTRHIRHIVALTRALESVAPDAARKAMMDADLARLVRGRG